MGSSPGYDIVGDVHGHAESLFGLLTQLGYRMVGGIWRHPDFRRVVFTGDLVHGGKDSILVLETARDMMAAGTALAVLGNHEASLLLHYTPGADGTPLRKMDARQFSCHGQDLGILSAAAPREWAAWMRWLQSLPLWLDLGGCRVVHACWHEFSMRRFPNGKLDDAALQSIARRAEARDALDILLKGPTWSSPEANGVRPRSRQWWMRGAGTAGIAIGSPATVAAEHSFAPTTRSGHDFSYPPGAPPLFIGHYALASDISSALLADNVVCVDSGVKNGGFLAAYRWNPGETPSADAFACFPPTESE